MTDTPYIWESNKTYLVVTDHLTSLIAGVIDSILVSGSGVIIVTSNSKTQKEIAQNIGILPFLIPIPSNNDNRSFFFDNMPGNLEELEVQSFPLWKGLGIDRLRFWQVNKGLLEEFVSKIKFDIAVIDFDMMSPLSSGWDMFDNIVVVKSYTLRTPEHYAFLKRYTKSINRVVTDKEIDKDYLKQIGVNNVSVWQAEKPFEPPIEKEYGDPCIYYDKRYIWQFNEYVERYGLLQPISFDQRSIDMFDKCHQLPNVQVVPPKAARTPSVLIMFAYDEEIIDAINPHKVMIFDPYGVNKAAEMFVGDDRVGFVNG